MDKGEITKELKRFWMKFGRGKYLEKIEKLSPAIKDILHNEREPVADERRKEFLLPIAGNVAVVCVICSVPILLYGMDSSYEHMNIRLWVLLFFVIVIAFIFLLKYGYAVFGVKEVFRMKAYYCREVVRKGYTLHMLCYYDFLQGKYRFQGLTRSHMSKKYLSSACEGELIEVIAVRSKRQVKLLYYEKWITPGYNNHK